MDTDFYHTPALLPETLDGLDIKPDGIYVDVTLGGGGHSRAIMERLSSKGHLYSLDQDTDAIARAWTDGRFTAIHGNFRHLANYCDYYGIEGKVDGILADLGVSSHHFDDASRGFSFRADGPLDMRMNKDAAVSAASMVANYSAEELERIFRDYGELRQARRVAAALVKARAEAPVDTTLRFTQVVEPLMAPQHLKKELAQVFQALRIAVNGEMDALEAFLKQSVEVLRPGGRLAVITYHSLEDRLVKNFMRSGRMDGKIETDLFGRSSAPLKPVSGKPVVPGEEEILANPRSRSAKLRVAVKL